MVHLNILASLPSWWTEIAPNPNLVLLVIGVSFFVFGVSRRRS